MWTWIKDKWNRFQNWVASWAPGLKVKVISALGFLGSAAAAGQEYITQVPLDKFVTGTQVAIISAVLFSLAFWARFLTNRA